MVGFAHWSGFSDMWIPKWAKVSLIILHYGACFKRSPCHGTDTQYWDRFCNSAFTIIFIGGKYFSIDNTTRRLIILTNIVCYLKFDILIWTKISWTLSFTSNNRNYSWLNIYQFSHLKFRLLAKWYCKSKMVILAINKPPRRLYSRVYNVKTHTQPGTAFVNIVYLISVSTVKSLI